MPFPYLETLRGSRGQAVPEHELELGQNHVPISTSGGPVLDNFPVGQVEHLAQGIVVGEARLVFCDLAELTAQALNNIRSVYDFPNLGWICEKGTQNIPVFLPAFDAGGVLLPHLSLNAIRFSRALSLVTAV